MTLALLLWALDPAAVARIVWGVGWGMALILAQEIVAHLFNGLGWRFAFAPGQTTTFPLAQLVKLRIAGDAVNYLTPSGTIAGEFTRTAMLNNSHQMEVRAASVVIAKCAQTLAQILFSALGVLVVFGTDRGWVPGLAWAVVTATAILAAIWFALIRLRRPTARLAVAAAVSGFRAVLAVSRGFVARYPERFTLSTAMFVLGYTGGAFEAYWICRFIGLPVATGTALTIEALSTAVDGLLFMVPAKIGTQEGGKAAVFVALGLPAASGLAFGVVRHLRELTWAAFGLILRWTHR